MLWLFTLAWLALLPRWPAVSLPALVVGFGSVALLDPIAASHAEAPRFLARLRPPQMAVALISLAVLYLVALLRT